MKPFARAAWLALSLLAVSPSRAGVDGIFRFEGGATRYTSACAFRAPAPERADQARTLVLLASRPLDCAAAEAGLDPVAVLKRQLVPGAGYLKFSVTDQGQLVDGEWLPPDSPRAAPFGLGSLGWLALKAHTPERIAGYWTSHGPVVHPQRVFQFDVAFDSPVSSAPLSTEPLPRDGGEPGEALRAYLAAVASKDRKGLERTLTAAQLENKLLTLDLTRDIEFRRVTLDSGLRKGDEAALYLRGESYNGWKFAGRMLMVRENGLWKVRERQTVKVN